MFGLVQRLYGLRIAPQTGVPAWDEAVRYYDVHDESGEFLGGFCGAVTSGWLGARQALMTRLAAGLALLAVGFAGSALMVRPWMPLSFFGCWQNLVGFEAMRSSIRPAKVV